MTESMKNLKQHSFRFALHTLAASILLMGNGSSLQAQTQINAATASLKRIGPNTS